MHFYALWLNFVMKLFAYAFICLHLHAIACICMHVLQFCAFWCMFCKTMLHTVSVNDLEGECSQNALTYVHATVHEKAALMTTASSSADTPWMFLASSAGRDKEAPLSGLSS